MKAAVLLLALLACTATHAADSPNIVLIMADDVGYFDLSVNGAMTIRTPNLDKLASEGTRFTQWYAPAALCTPSRGAMLTGRLPIRIGLYTTFSHPADLGFRVFYPSSVGSLPANETTIAGALKSKGYTSAMIGKWHLGHVDALPTQRGFDYHFGVPYSHDEGYPGPYPLSAIWPAVPVYRNEHIVEQPVNLDTFTQRMTNESISFISDNVRQNKPFFLYVGYLQAHIPYFASPQYRETSRRGHYGDMMEEMDASIGEILNYIESMGIADNTIVVFTSDNGAWPDAREPLVEESEEQQNDGGSNGPLKEGKGSNWEGGVREPAIFKWPGKIRAGYTTMEFGSHLDLLPTFMEFAGAPLPSVTLDGKSLVSLLTGETDQGPHEFHFYWRESELTAVRWGPWKCHFQTRSGFGTEDPVYHNPCLLFNIERDLSEAYPVNTETHADIVNTITAAADAHRASVTAGIPQYETGGRILGQDWSVVPCCTAQDNTITTTDKLTFDRWEQCNCNNDSQRLFPTRPNGQKSGFERLYESYRETSVKDYFQRMATEVAI